MNLYLLRHTWTSTRTLGTLYKDGEPFCFTLEDADRCMFGLPKIKAQTAIQQGIYETVVTFSQRFQKPMPLLLNVPEFTGIRIHSGNTEADTEGCILVGQQLKLDSVLSSRLAFSALMAAIRAGTRLGKVHLQIVRGSLTDQAGTLLEEAWT